MKIYFHDWMTIQTLLSYLPPLDSNIASVGWSVCSIAIGGSFLGMFNNFFMQRKQDAMRMRFYFAY